MEFRGNSNPGRKQCDQMARLFFNIWPFTTMKFCPKAYKKSKSGFTTLPNIKYTFQMLPKISKFLLNWRNFAKSVHSFCDHSHKCFYNHNLRLWRHRYSRKKIVITNYRVVNYDRPSTNSYFISEHLCMQYRPRHSDPYPRRHL